MGTINRFVTEELLQSSISDLTPEVNDIKNQIDTNGEGINKIYAALENMSCANANATKDDLLLDKVAYTQEGKIVGTIPTKTISDITVNSEKLSIPKTKFFSFWSK